jgi:hypothetical protein
MLLRKKSLRDTGLWVIFIYLCYGVVTEAINTYYNLVYDDNPYFNFDLFSIVEYILLTIYIRRIVRNKTFKTIILVSLVLFVPYATYNLFGPYYKKFDSVSTSLESILLIIYAIFYLFEQITKPNHIFFYSIPEFWVIVTILLYFSGTFFLGLYASGLLDTDKDFHYGYQLIGASFDILKNLLLGVAMVVKGNIEDNNIPRNSHKEHLNLNR